MNVRRLLLLLVLLGTATSLRAQAPDSLRVLVPVNTLRAPDSTVVPADTLTEAQKAQQRFEERYRTMKAAEAKQQVPFSYDDTLAAYFLTPRLNARADRERSYAFNAGDYLRFDPSLVQLRCQPTPARQTLQPYSLSGNRLSVLAGSSSLEPFEHLVEPDGQLDANDLPMTLNDEVYLIPGALGTLFGSTQSVATYLARPATLNDNNAHSAFLVDKGWGGLSNARGRFSRKFTSGKLINMAMAYRQGTGFSASDKSYHYDGAFAFPVKERLTFKVDGHMYDRRGEFVVWPDVYGSRDRWVNRHRYDRTLAVSLAKANDSASAQSEIGYRYVKQGSELSRDYSAQDHQTGHRLFARHSWVRGSTLGQLELTGDALNYDNGRAEFGRLSGAATFRLARAGASGRWGLVLGQRYVESTRWLPMATAVWERQSDKLLLLASVGYNEREPSLMELHAPTRQGNIYGSLIGYEDSGNRDLDPERQLIGSLTAELGHTDQAWRVSVTGGQILDGIDWDHQIVSVDSVSYLQFRPYNGDLSFVGISTIKKFRLGDLLRLTGGGSYNFVDYSTVPDHAYTPEYQAFSNAEIHLPWKRKMIDLYASGDLTYLGPYRSYFGTELGDQVILTGRLGFTMGRFQFFYQFHNLLDNIIEQRENYSYYGRYYTWGFVWNFLN